LLRRFLSLILLVIPTTVYAQVTITPSRTLSSGGAGSGDVVGPSSATDGNFTCFDGTTGKLIKECSAISSIHLTNTGLTIDDTNASHVLTIKPGSDITANRTFTLTTGDANRTLTMSGDATISGTNTGDQNLFGSIVVSGQTTVTASANPTALTLVAGSNITLTTDNTGKAITITAAGGGGGGDFSTNTSSSAANEIVSYADSGGKLGGRSLFIISGPASTAKTYTFPNSSVTILYSGGPLGTPASGTLTNATGLTEAGLSLADNTINNVSISNHGFVKKLDGNSAHFLDGTGNFTAPAGASGVTRSGATTDLHAAVWNGSSADSIKDGGQLFSFTDPNADKLIYWNDGAGGPGSATLSSGFTFSSGNLGLKLTRAYAWIAAATQAGTATLAFNTQGSGAAAAATSGSTILVPTASFPDGSTTELQFHFPIPTDWDGTAMTLIGKWRANTTSGTATWSIEGKCAADGAVAPTTYSATPDTGADTAKGTVMQLNDFTITLSVASGHSLATCTAGSEFWGRISLNNSLGVAAELLSFSIYNFAIQ